MLFMCSFREVGSLGSFKLIFSSDIMLLLLAILVVKTVMYKL